MNKFSPELGTTITLQPDASQRWRVVLYADRRSTFDDIVFWLESMTDCDTDFAYEICRVLEDQGRAVCFQGCRSECHEIAARLRPKGLQIEVDDY